MRNIIEKLGHKKTYWFGMITPPFMVFAFFSVENSSFFRSLSVLVEESVLHGKVPGSLVVGTAWMFFGVLVPLLTLGRIRCPKCKKRLVLSFLNTGDSEKESPLKSNKCPHCGYDPEKV